MSLFCSRFWLTDYKNMHFLTQKNAISLLKSKWFMANSIYRTEYVICMLTNCLIQLGINQRCAIPLFRYLRRFQYPGSLYFDLETDINTGNVSLRFRDRYQYLKIAITNSIPISIFKSWHFDHDIEIDTSSLIFRDNINMISIYRRFWRYQHRYAF